VNVAITGVHIFLCGVVFAIALECSLRTLPTYIPQNIVGTEVWHAGVLQPNGIGMHIPPQKVRVVLLFLAHSQVPLLEAG